jgi:hypothetical protein
MDENDPLPAGVWNAMQTLALDQAAATAADRLRVAGIPTLLLKGPSFSRWLYSEEATRSYVDIDLLVPFDLAAAAESELMRAGFTRSGYETIQGDRPRYAVSLRSPQGDWIDLHRTLIGVGKPERLFAVLAGGARPFDVGGGIIDEPPAPGRALVLALHAAKEASRSEKVGADLARAMEVVPVDVWTAAAKLAEEVGALEAFAAGVRRDPAGPKIAERLGLPDELTKDVSLRTTKPPPLAVGLDYVLDSQGIGGKVIFGIRKAFPPPSFMRSWRPLARRGTIGLAVAYVYRPFWLIVKTVPAAIAVRRARRAARDSRSAQP